MDEKSIKSAWRKLLLFLLALVAVVVLLLKAISDNTLKHAEENANIDTDWTTREQGYTNMNDLGNL